MSLPAWNLDDLPDQTGRTAIVTGANSGLGLVMARALAGAGAHVVLAVRDTDRGRAAARTVMGRTSVARLDLADLKSVRAFAADWAGPVDLLINNAGIMAVPAQRTVDGLELQIGTNHLGHFALTNLLLPQITDRVVTMSSAAHRMGRICLDDLNWEHRRYRRWGAYGQSKLANLLFTVELERRLAASGSAVRAFAAHPGYAATQLQGRTGSPLLHAMLTVANALVAQSDDQGALPALFAATQNLPGGTYVGPGGSHEIRGHPVVVGRSARASDLGIAYRLWELSEELTGVGSGVPAVSGPPGGPGYPRPLSGEQA